MVTSAECNRAWTNGFNDGYKSMKGTTTSVPSMPPLPASESNPIQYYYEKGKEAGIAAAKSK